MSYMKSPGRKRWFIIIGAVVAILVIAGLLLPPASVLERTGIVCSGNTVDAEHAAVVLNGLTVALSDPTHTFTFKAKAVEPAEYETASAGEDLAAAQSAQPVALTLSMAAHFAVVTVAHAIDVNVACRRRCNAGRSDDERSGDRHDAHASAFN